MLNFDKGKDVNSFLLPTSEWFAPQILGPTRVSEQNKPSLKDNLFMHLLI